MPGWQPTGERFISRCRLSTTIQDVVPIAVVGRLIGATNGQLDIPYGSLHDAGMNAITLQRR